VDAILDEHGLFQLAACHQPWVVVDAEELHRLVIDHEPEPPDDHSCSFLDAETFGDLGRSRDGGNLDDLLLWPMTLLAHLRVETSFALALVTAVVLGGQGDGNWGRRADKGSLSLAGSDQPPELEFPKRATDSRPTGTELCDEFALRR
jgi:hypothetical protein